MLDRYDKIEMGRAVAGDYGRIAAALRASSRLIGANDLWIAASALSAGLPLVTNNTVHFARVPGLSPMGY